MERDHISCIFHLHCGCKCNRNTAYLKSFLARRLITKNNWDVIIKLAGSLHTGGYFAFSVIQDFHLKLEMTNKTMLNIEGFRKRGNNYYRKPLE